MLRRAVLAVCLCAFCLSLGCDSNATKPTNPNNLEYGQQPPPKREGAPKMKR